MSEREITKPILCLDFDGVIHSYSSGWKGAREIPDPPVDGALIFIKRATDHFHVNIYSSRTAQDGVIAMQKWLEAAYMDDLHWSAREAYDFVRTELFWPRAKPPAMVTIDDRAITFDGTWPEMGDLLEFKPWNKR